jgi:2-methylcitrate dehydratase PrpD
MNETVDMAKWVYDLKYGEIPDQALESAKMHLLDFIGGIIYCSTNEHYNKDYFSKVLDDFTGQDSTVIFQKRKTNQSAAAMLNSLLGHGFELDDYHAGSFFHASAVIVPILFAVSEKYDLNPKDVLLGMVAGTETGIRIGLSLTVKHNLRGFHPTGTIGPFAGVVALSKAKRLPLGTLINALGIAGSMSSAIKEFYREGNSEKRFHPSRAGSGAMTAIAMAESGVTGPSTVLEGNFGFLHAFTDNGEPDKINEGLGKHWFISDLSIKPYACCGGLHSAIYGLLEYIDELSKRADKIKSITIETCRKVALQNGKFSNDSVMGAQYSLPFTTALTILKDITNPSVFNEKVLNDENICALAKKVIVKEAPDIKSMNHTRIKVIFNDNSSIQTEVTKPKGYLGNMMTLDDVKEKFKNLTDGVFSENERELIIKDILNFESLNSIKDFMKKLY